MDIQSVLKHMSQYWEVYQYVAENGAGSMEDIKSYLIEQCHKPESTARGNISAIKDSPLFKITEGYVMLDDNAGLKLEEILEYIFEWSYKDARHEEIKELKEKIEQAERRENSQKDTLKEKETEWKQKELQYKEKLSKQKEQHQGQMETLKKKHQAQGAMLEKQLELLQSQNMDLQCSQKTLLLMPLGVNPEQVGFYQDAMFPMSDRHPTVDETKRLMDTYVAKTFNGDTKKGHCELNLHNWRWRIVDGFFSGKVIDAMWERMGAFKTWAHRYWPHKNMITVEKLLQMTDKTSTEKYALYLLCRDNFSLEQKELIHLAQEAGIHADFTIQLLEDYHISKKTKEKFWEALQLAKDDSEYRMRWTFTQELLEHKWHIRQDYCGQMCDYELEPVEDFNNMQKKLKEHISQLKKSKN